MQVCMRKSATRTSLLTPLVKGNAGAPLAMMRSSWTEEYAIIVPRVALSTENRSKQSFEPTAHLYYYYKDTVAHNKWKTRVSAILCTVQHCVYRMDGWGGSRESSCHQSYGITLMSTAHADRGLFRFHPMTRRRKLFIMLLLVRKTRGEQMTTLTINIKSQAE